MNIKEHLTNLKKQDYIFKDHVDYLYKLKKIILNQKLFMILVVVFLHGLI